tara:strand:+ start:2552 stop:9124 length:6573 start_codon:yes stop_codon:yes gene_type:complete
VQIKDKLLTLITRLISLWFCFMLPLDGLAQLSTRHYIPPIPAQYYQGYEIYNSSFLYISTPYDEARFTIKPVGQSATNWITGVVKNSDSYKIQLSNDEIGADPSVVQNDFIFTDKGFEIVADREIYVSLRIKANNHAGALVSKGVDGLGKDFRVGGMERQGNDDFSFFSIMATQNNTLVEFTSDPQLVALNTNGTLPQSIVLNNNESYIALFSGPNCARFIGTQIQSQNDIIVNTGSILGSFSNEIIDSPDFYPGERDFGYLNGSDMGFDQLVSLDSSVDATEYLLVKGDGFNSIENALIIANEDETEILLNGDTSSLINLNKGEHVFIEGNLFTDNSNSAISFINISSNKNIYVFQGTGKKGEAEGRFPGGQRVHFYGANQGMFFVPPLSCTSVGDVESIARINEVDENSIFNGSLFILSSYGSSVKVNENDILSLNNVTFEPGPIQSSSADYQIHRVDGLDGDVSVVGSNELYVSYYNVNNTATSGAFYSGFTLEPKIYPNLSLNSLGNCVDSSGQSNVILQIPNAENYDSLKWQKQKDDGGWQNIFTGTSDSSEYTPDSFGSYRLKVVIDCLSPNSIVYSSAINVSICPNDSDKDGVVDNVDLDNDNDGIYDKIESFGDFEIDLTTTPPKLVVDKPLPYSTPVLSQVLSVGNGTFTPFNDGRFTSFLPPKQNSDDAVRYQLKPDVPKSIHFSFGFDNSESAIPDQENSYYILESIDLSESITLLDPENELEILENSNFVNGYSFYNNSKITFKFNSDAVGKNSKFIFQVNNSSGLIFTHHNGSSGDSVFNGILSIRNLDQFSDDDLSADKYDLDSDDDGCFDIDEAGYLDPDLDGKVGQSPLTVDDNTVSNNGAVINHPYATTREGPRPYDRDYNGVFDFQEGGAPAEISPNGNPISVEVCEGETATFSVDTPTENANFQWIINGVPAAESETFIGVTTNTLYINTESAFEDSWLDGAEIQVLVSKPTYTCPVESIKGVFLTINQVPETPVVEPIYTYCYEDSPTVEDLKNNIGGAVGVFLSSASGSALTDNTLLLHNQNYFIEAYSPKGCSSLTRAETEVFISNPELLSSKSQICFGEEISLSVNGVPATGQDFALANPEFERFLEYGSSSYFLKRESMTWTDAYDLIQSLGNGASMYVINSKEEESAVYSALDAIGVAGTGDIHFWLGLRQQSSLNPNNNVDEGWQWLDGRMLSDELANWSSGEPNDYGPEQTAFEEDGGEDYAQFDFFEIKTWNDMTNDSPTSGDSWPVFEFTGTTEVVWGKIDPITNSDIVFDGVETSTITDSPTETTTYFYEVTTNGVVCRVETTIVVNPLPEILPADDLELCDNAIDGDAYNGLVNGFDLQAQEVSILNGDESIEVLFFINENDLDDNPIDKTQSFNNRTNPEQIYYRIQNKTTGCVSDETGSFSLRVLPIPPVVNIPPHYECDNLASGSNTDNITTFDLRLNDARIKALLGGASDQYQISYHNSASDAENPASNGIDFYTMNPTENGQKTIYIRVTDKLTSLQCENTINNFDLILSPLPVIETPVINFEQCDETDGVSDGVVLTNLRSFENIISTNSLNELFSYYTDNSFSSSTKIDDPSSYYNIDSLGNPILNSTIFVQVNSILPDGVYAPNGSCISYAEINLNVVVSQIKADFMLDFNACELTPSIDQDGKTQFSSDIFDTLTSELLKEHPLFTASGVVIRFFPSLDDAARKLNEIDTDKEYENLNPVINGNNWNDEIWASVEVEGLNTISCIGLKKVASLFVERLPTAHPVAPFRECDDDDDGVYPFDTTRLLQELTLGQNNINVSFFDKDYNLLFSDALPNPYVSSSQTIFARVENTSSVNTPSCYEETEITFIVDDTPNFNPLLPLVLCDDSDGVIDQKAAFDTTSIESNILNGQTDITLNYFDSNGNILPSPLPQSFSTESTSILVELVSNINNSCISEGIIEFEVIDNPLFDLDEQAVLCLNEASLDLEVQNPSDIYTYHWEYVGENNELSSVGSTSKVTISTGGIYQVTATTGGSFGCTTTKTIEVITSELAKLKDQDIIIRGFSSRENTVEVLIDNLGIGDYEFALDNGSFQDEPYFTQVKPGMRTVSVRDKIGCGTATAQIGVVGYYKYFTPNNDGINDSWQILGLKTTFNSKSNVYIYDRYGRFLYQISDPDESWDGSYRGQPLPADDYWFRLELEDGRVYTGHFSLMR